MQKYKLKENKIIFLGDYNLSQKELTLPIQIEN